MLRIVEQSYNIATVRQDQIKSCVKRCLHAYVIRVADLFANTELTD